MSESSDSGPDRPSSSTQNLQRAIWIVLAVLIAVVVVFFGYYVWDRYVHLGDQSSIDVGAADLERAIRDDPQNVEARVALAESYLSAGQVEKALEQAVQVLSQYPENHGALLIAGMAYVHLDQPEAALAPLERFVALRKEGPMAQADTALEAAYYFLGESYVKLNRPAEAIPVLEAALAISPADADALYQAGLAYQATGQPEAALERYHRAVRLVPDFAEAYSGMVEAYTATGQSDYKEYAQGMEAFSLGDYKAALSHLEGATQALPEFTPAFLGLGLTYEKMSQWEAAESAIARALELDPQDFAAQQALGRIQSMPEMQP
jgi:tetratricopeptide (TPR) repeat protein